MDIRERLHQYVDELSEPELEALERVMKRIGEDPVLYAHLSAPEDDEPETAEEAQAIAEAYDAIERGDIVSDEDVKRELGL